MEVHVSRRKNWWAFMKISLLLKCNMKHFHGSAGQSEKELVRNYENQSPMEMHYETVSWKCTPVGERIGEKLWKSVFYGIAIWNIFMEVQVSRRKNCRGFMKISLLWKCDMKDVHESARQSLKELVRNYENQSPTEWQYETCSCKCTSVGERIGEKLWKSVFYGNAI